MNTKRINSTEVFPRRWIKSLPRLFTSKLAFWLYSAIAGIIAFAEWGTNKDKGQEKGSSNYLPIPLDITAAQGGEVGATAFNGTAQLNPNSLFGITINGTTEGGGSGFAVRNESGTGGDGLYGSTASDLTGANGFAGVHGENTNPDQISGFGVVGITQSSGGAGVGGFANHGPAVGVLGYTTSSDSPSAGVKAQYAGGGAGTALEVTGGAIKITGAGLGTNTAAFIHEVTSSNWVPGYLFTWIDHPLVNGDPTVLLIVTRNDSPAGVGFHGGVDRFMVTRVFYGSLESVPDLPQCQGRWCIDTVSLMSILMSWSEDAPLVADPHRYPGRERNDQDAYGSRFLGTCFNVLVIKT